MAKLVCLTCKSKGEGINPKVSRGSFKHTEDCKHPDVRFDNTVASLTKADIEPVINTSDAAEVPVEKPKKKKKKKFD